ncbi:hypothetical protein ANO11243_050590 [Dothideomycetidae sp. 11243]|nr:hypothetical protein ANO11243_050590 [fungal sp. No.11243]
MNKDHDDGGTCDKDANIYVRLTRDKLDAGHVMNQVRSPACGAIVLFAGTTRDNFEGKPVKHLAYSSYDALALRSMLVIAKQIKTKHQLHGISIVHRLGVVPIGQESVLIAVSSAHRQAAWRSGEEALELIKEKVEIWKLEEFGGDEGGIWRANRDGQPGVKVGESDPETAMFR